MNVDGHRKILGLQITSAEDGAGWLALPGPDRVRPDRVELVTSDAHNGLVAAVGATLPGASWQTHSSANISDGGRFPLVHRRRRTVWGA